MEKTNVINKTDLVDYIKTSLNEQGVQIRKDQVTDTLNCFVDSVKDLVYDGNTVRINGFATFYSVDIPERTVFGKPAPAHRSAKAKVSPSWKNLTDEE